MLLSRMRRFTSRISRSNTLCRTMISLLSAALIGVLPATSGFADEPTDLTDAEKAWVADQKTIRVANELDWPPFDFAVDGKPKGYSIDLIRLVAKKVGLDIQFVNGFTWSELVAKFRARELDVLPAIFTTEERREFIAFTESYISNPSILAVHADNLDINGIADLSEKTIAVIPAYATTLALAERYPDIQGLPVRDAVGGLEAVSIKKADAFIGTLGVISYVLEKNAIPGIRIAGASGLKLLEETELRMGVAKDNVVLRDILQKGLNAISPDEQRSLRERWLPLAAAASNEQLDENETAIWDYWIVAGIIFILLAMVIVLGRMLDRPVTDEEMAGMTAARHFWLAVTFSNLKISSKVLIVLVLIAATSVGIFGAIEYEATRETLQAESFNKLTAVRELKALQIEDYFRTINDQIVAFSESESAVRAAQNFGLAFNIIQGQETRRKYSPVTKQAYQTDVESLAGYYQSEFLPRLQTSLTGQSGISSEAFIPDHEAVQRLQSLFIAKNPHPTGAKHEYDGPGDGSVYDNLHQRHHPMFRSFLEKFGYYDIFLVEPETGHIVYSVFKEVDFGTSLLTGPYRESNFARVFRQARNAKNPNAVFLADFEPYAPSYNAPAAFISSPIFSGSKLVGVAVFQMPIDRINQIMTSHNGWKEVGLGASGETYIVGSDHLMRNQSRFLIEDRDNYLSMIRSVGTSEDTVHRIETFNSSVGLQTVRTQGTRAALAGKTNTEIFPDYRGVRVLSSYRPLKLRDLNWVIMSEIDEAEAFVAIEELKQRVIILIGVLLIAIGGISFVFAKAMTRPIKILTAKAETLAMGELEIDIDTHGGDEISHLARSFDVMRNALKELIGDLEARVEERTRELRSSEERIRSIIENTADGIIVINGQGIIQVFSPAAEEIFGYQTYEVIGKKINALMPAPYHSEHDDYLKHYFETGEKRVVGYNREVVGLRKDGSTFPMDLAVGEVWIENERLFTGIIRDITERKAMEHEITLANERMGEELNVGRDIQMSMIPTEFPRFPEHKEIDVWAYLRPAREVGGDFYDFFYIHEDRFAFVVADVSGKGVPAALMMAVAKTLLKSNSQLTLSTAEIVELTNNELSKNNDDCMFITVFFGIMNTKTGEVTYTNAGHNPPYLMTTDGTFKVLGDVHGPMIGAMDGVPYDEAKVVLGVDDKLVLFTDGVTEAFDAERQAYGEERLEEMLGRVSKLGTKYLVDELVQEVDDFVGEAEQSDDITVFCLRHVAWEGREDRALIELHLKNELSEIERCLQGLAEFCERFDIAAEIQQGLSVVLDDLLNNIVSYAFDDEEEHIIEVSLATDGERLIVTVSDDGVEFDPFERAAPDTESDIDERQIGGLGIHLIKNLMDDFSYQPIDGRNVVVLMKRMGD